MARSDGTFRPGHAKVGGRKNGTCDEKILARDEMVEHSLRAVRLTPEQIEQLTPLAVMRLVMAARLKAGDHAGALMAAEAAAPYVHAKLSSTDVRVQSEITDKTNGELTEEIAALEVNMPPSAADVVRIPCIPADAGLSVAELLRLTPLFESLDVPLIDALSVISQETCLPAGEDLCRQGDLPAHLHILLDGQVALWGKAPDGSGAVVEVIRPPGYFVLATVLTRLPYMMTARTISPTRVILIDAAGLHGLLEREVGLANALLHAEAVNFRSLVRQVQDLKLRSAAQRLGCYLLALADDPDAPTARFSLPFEKRLLAGRLGCRQENLSRAFAALRNVGVETHGSRVILHDILALRAFAVPDERTDPDLPFSG